MGRLTNRTLKSSERTSIRKERGVGFRSISDGVVDTTSPSGELVFNIFSALAQFERRLIQERTIVAMVCPRLRRLGQLHHSVTQVQVGANSTST